ncbi:MAG: sulfatase-like hydrolase/transferase [Vicinamibacterales bacterium]
MSPRGSRSRRGPASGRSSPFDDRRGPGRARSFRPSRRTAVAGLLALAAAAGAYWAWSAEPALPVHPNVLLITLDTTRADRLGSYGYASAGTPNLDRLALDGVRFARALSPVPLTLPAHASLMTGLQPYRHGVRNNGHFVLPEDVPTLAARFSAAGYETAAFVSAFVLDRQFGLARGFDVYDDALDPPAVDGAGLELERRGDRTASAAAAWLARRSQAPRRPWFLWVHFYDAHDPYAPPAPFAERHAATPYDGEIAFVDAQVGRLLESPDVQGAAPPLVIVAGDHGESLGDHGESTHGLFLYEGAIKVPLIVAWPGILRRQVVDTAVRLVDVAPTLARLAGVEFGATDGRDLTPLVRRTGEAPEPAPPAYAETYFPQFFMRWAPLRAVDDGRWKYIDGPEPELYEIATDPGEARNRAATDPAVARALKRTLETSVRATPDRSAQAPVSAEAQRRLSALGYVATPAVAQAGETGPDPKRMVPIFERLLAGNRAIAGGRAGEAARIARDVIAQDGANPFARLVLGRALLAGGDAPGAVAALTTYLAAVPGSAEAHHWLALAHVRQDRRDLALAEEEAALALDPRLAPAIALRAGLLFSSGRAGEGLEALRAAVEAQPNHAALRTDYADLLADAGRVDEAAAEYQRALDRRGDDTRALVGLGMLLARQSALDRALALFTKALELDAGQEEARIERAAVYSRLGRARESRADLERLTGPEVRPDIRATALRELAAMRRR